MEQNSFSVREGLRSESSLIYDEAPGALRYGLREVLHVLGYQTPTAQRLILCKSLRVIPDRSNWTDYPNIEDEVVYLLETEPWHKFFDALERIRQFLSEEEAVVYYERMNALFADERVGYRFESGNIVRVGTEEFHDAVRVAQHALTGERFAEPRRQFERACEFRNALPADWSNAIKEAVNSVEAVLQIIYERPSATLTSIASNDFPAELPGNIKKLFLSLYGQGSGTVGARHASIGGNEPSGPRAELAIHMAAALHAFAVSELDAKDS